MRETNAQKPSTSCSNCRWLVQRTVTRGFNRLQYLKCADCGKTGKRSFQISRAGNQVLVCGCCGNRIETET